MNWQLFVYTGIEDRIVSAVEVTGEAAESIYLHAGLGLSCPRLGYYCVNYQIAAYPVFLFEARGYRLIH